MNIVVLDGFALNPGDLSWHELESLGSCRIYNRTGPADVVSRSLTADILLTNKTQLSAKHIQSLPALKYIGVLATGTNVVDLAAARSRGISVTNVPSYGTSSVAQATFALLLELTHHAGHHAQTVRAGRWGQSLEWCYWDWPLIELAGLTFGIIGFGRIGHAVAQLAVAFGMNVLAISPTPKPNAPDVRFVDLGVLLRQSDVVSLHCPLTPQTTNLIDATRLSLMKPTAFLLNTSRGALVNEAALAEALNSGRLGGAGLDVLSIEPPREINPLIAARNCVITPHLAWATRAARKRLMVAAVANVRSFLEGQAMNLVN